MAGQNVRERDEIHWQVTLKQSNHSLVSNTVVRTSARLVPLILALYLESGCANTTSLSDLKISPSQNVAYPDNDAGFKEFIGELVEAHARGRNVQSRMHTVLIPNSSAWFTNVFGPTSGPVLDFQYRYQLGYQFERLYTYLPIYGDGQKLVHTEHCEPGHLSPFVADSELIPLAEQSLKIYSAAIATNQTGPWLKVGSFVYIDGDFRYLGSLAIAPNWPSFYNGYDKAFEP